MPFRRKHLEHLISTLLKRAHQLPSHSRHYRLSPRVPHILDDNPNFCAASNCARASRNMAIRTAAIDSIRTGLAFAPPKSRDLVVWMEREEVVKWLGREFGRIWRRIARLGGFEGVFCWTWGVDLRLGFLRVGGDVSGVSMCVYFSCR